MKKCLLSNDLNFPKVSLDLIAPEKCSIVLDHKQRIPEW